MGKLFNLTPYKKTMILDSRLLTLEPHYKPGFFEKPGLLKPVALSIAVR